MAEAPVSKRGKWLARFAAAYPDDDDIRIEALRADISSGACARAKKTLFALAGRGDDIATVHPRLYECFMEYGRTMFLRKDHNEALAAFEMAMKKTTGDILIATKIKQGSMLLALGRKKEGESFIAAGLESMTHKEEGFLLALIELKRLRAQPKLIEEYERSLRKLVKEGKITSPLPLIDIHSSCLTAYHYPGMKKETELILEMLKGMTGREFREAE